MESKIRKLEDENEKMKNNENNLKEQIELKEKDIIQLQIKLKEIKSINNVSNLYNTNNYRSKSNLSKSNSSINIYKDNLTENKDNNINYFNNNINNINLFNKKNNNNSLYNNIHMANKIKKVLTLSAACLALGLASCDTVEAKLPEDAEVLTFTDNGIHFNPLNVPEPDIKNVEDRKEGGMGIFLVRKFSDKLQYEYSGGKNILKITKKRLSKTGK